MKGLFKSMQQDEAELIAYECCYEGNYAFYNITADAEDLAEFLDQGKRGDRYFSVYENEQLVGYFCFQFRCKDELEIGLGMRPDLTGAGKGSSFLHGGLDFVIDKYHPKKIILAVATFNQRAIKVYQKAGFIIVDTYSQQINGGIYEFHKMVFEWE